MNDLIVQAILDEFMKKSYDWEFGDKIVTLKGKFMYIKENLEIILNLM
jgi:hypothetical protein